VHDPLGDAFVVEVEELLAEGEVLQQRRSALADAQRVLSSATGTPCSVVNVGPPS